MDRLAGCRILIVEDSEMLAASMCECLEDAGAKVVGLAACVDSALRILDDRPVDAVVLDIKLGGEMAYGLAERLATTGTPFLFTTGYPAKAIDGRFADRPVCLKPFSARTLVNGVHALCGPACAT